MKNAPTDSITILQDLIRCRSVTPAEGGALRVLENLLSSHGFVCHRLIFKEEGTADVENLFARIGTGGPHLCFAGHTDVVPPGEEVDWTHPPFAAEIADGFLYGRGAVDMKGPVAAFATAAIDHLKSGGRTRGSISLLITGDEEGPAINGTVKVLQWMRDNGHLPDHCIVGEPSSADKLGDTIKIGRRGSLSFAVTVDGRQGHAAYPHKADNPIPKIARFISTISSASLDDGTDHFDPSTLAVTSVDVGNPATNVIPARAVAKFNIRFNPTHGFDSLRQWVNERIAETKAELGGIWSVASSEGAEAFITEPGAFVGQVQDAIEQETGLLPKLSTSGGTSDARFIKDYCPVLEFGPTNATIHQTDERISVAELKATQAVYSRILEAYFNRPPQ
ncbi:MAG: succinyl-diaminopimelate desuccinylase [Rhizobiales bacterium]|nr:succinyl-diaminopimelate desuccinylase [Hyphomicrobiales bacterium]MBI3674626.1 succinyl-diaminopimelate desuccinylase [Hyphomicrobiales bacterium]